MLEPVDILQTVDRLLAYEQGGNTKRILITAGGTREPIDSVRYIGNMSSGRTACALADELTAAGHRVTWLGARDAVQPTMVNRLELYTSFSDLQTRLKDLLGAGEYDVVVHAAAVSDFSVAGVETDEGNTLSTDDGKLSSNSDLVLHLKRNPKLLNHLKDWSGNPALQVIGFKLTDTKDLPQRLAAIRKQLDNSEVDAVVHNDLSDISETAHRFCFHRDGQEPVTCGNSGELALTINQLLETVS
jgi:phosphopantothenoylcysteine decarboxylase/phosphopantothenate--cysteine ligase